MLPDRVRDGELVLRHWRRGDVEALGRAVGESLDHLRPWMPWIASEPLSSAARLRLVADWERDWRAGGDSVLGVFLDNRAAGGCGLHRRQGPDRLEIGYWTHVAFLRRGIATRVTRLLTTAAFTMPGIEYVEIHHDQANLASAGVPRRLGFELAGSGPNAIPAPADRGTDRRWRVSRSDWTVTEARL